MVGFDCPLCLCLHPQALQLWYTSTHVQQKASSAPPRRTNGSRVTLQIAEFATATHTHTVLLLLSPAASSRHHPPK
eukprot:scaffold118164_cov17-Tisochrysis_lutea.AAC.1